MGAILIYIKLTVFNASTDFLTNCRSLRYEYGDVHFMRERERESEKVREREGGRRSRRKRRRRRRERDHFSICVDLEL